MEAGGDAAHAGAGEGGGERLEEDGALAAVALAGGADVAVEGAAGDQLGQRPFVEAGAAAVGHGPGEDDGRHQLGREQQPAEPEGGGQGLGDGAGEHDRVGCQALQAAGRPAVVTQLGVVVVLEDQGAAVAGPGDQAAAPARLQHGPERQRVGGGDDHRVGRHRGQGGDVDAVVVDRHRHHLEPLGFDRPAGQRVARVLDRDAAAAAPAQQLAEQPQALLVAGGHHHPLRRGHRGPHPPEVLGEGDPQLGGAGELAVAEAGVGQPSEGAPQRPAPGAAREQREVGGAGEEVDAGDRRRHRGRLRERGRGRPGGARRRRRDPGAGAAAGEDVALGRELFVGLDHQPPRDAELGGEGARGGQAAVGSQPPRPDRLAQAGLQLGAAGLARIPPRQQQIRRAGGQSGPRFSHFIGP